MSDPKEKDDPDEQLVLNVLDSDEFDPAAATEGTPELFGELVRVRAIMQAFDSLGMAPAATPPPIPKWGPFVLREQVGRGRFGTVCRGFDPAVQRDVAVKLYAGTELPAEPRLMARVRHPNVVTVFGAAVHEGQPGIWMEFIHGHSLGHRVQTDGPLPPDEVLRIGIALCDALTAVHGAQLVHQDVKARNVMQEDSGRIVLMDFGAGLSSDAGDQPERFSGTPVYMAPEVMLGQRPSVTSDVYSLGVLLYYLLTGTYPVYAPDVEELRRLHERHHRAGTRRFVATLRELRPEVSPTLARCLAKALAPTDHRYKTAAQFETALETVRLGVSERPRRLARALAATTVVLCVGVTTGWWIGRPRPEPTATLKRLTWDDGLTTDPAVSPDGKLFAYASDRGGEGSLDIWVQQFSGGEPLRLTADAADDSQPDFSPDGDQIAFRSERGGGGIYVVSTLGGEPRLLAPGGRWPRFSPDHRWIAYLSGSGGALLFVVPASGGAPRRINRLPPGNAVTATPIWSHDGKHILVLQESYQGSASAAWWDWWVVPVDDSSEPIRTGASTTVFPGMRPFIDELPIPWAWRNDRILFAGRYDDTTNLWEVDISPRTFKIAGSPRRLTTSSENQTQPVQGPNGRVLFSTPRASQSLWEFPLDGTPKTTADARVVTDRLAPHGFHGLSSDGRLLAFTAIHLGNMDIWFKDLRSGSEMALTSSPWSENLPVIARDGSRVLFRTTQSRRESVQSSPTAGGLTETICEECGAPTDLSPDGRTVPLQHALTEHATLEALDLASGKRQEILKHDGYLVYRGHFSPDGRWVVFHGARPQGGTREFAAAFRGLSRIREEDWIPLTEEGIATDAARWSSDGNRIYYVATRDGFPCVWGQALDPATKHPTGPPVPVFHSHGRQHSLANIAVAGVDLSVAADKIIMNMGDLKSNIWSAEFR